jgi:oligoendopeptidase F
MERKIRLRNEVPADDTWDLTSLYKNAEEWEKDIIRITEMSKDFEQYKGKLINSPEQMLSALKEYSILQEVSEKAGS